jgi:hypothetical protein
LSNEDENILNVTFEVRLGDWKLQKQLGGFDTLGNAAGHPSKRRTDSNLPDPSLFHGIHYHFAATDSSLLGSTCQSCGIEPKISTNETASHIANVRHIFFQNNNC